MVLDALVRRFSFLEKKVQNKHFRKLSVVTMPSSSNT